MKYQVVNPATGLVAQEYPTATDAEIGDILDRAGRGQLTRTSGLRLGYRTDQPGF